MHAWEQVQQTIEYIEEHLTERIAIESLAKMASLSPFYYQRLFRRLVKKPIGEYVKLRRMAKAAESLLQKDRRILDIALDLGFSSHEQFSRVFKEAFRLTPDEYRKNPQTLNRMTKPELSLHYTLIDEGVPLVTDGIVLEVHRRELAEPIRFIGMQRDLSTEHLEGLGTKSGVDPLAFLWRSFHDRKRTLLGLFEETEEIGISYPSSEKGCFSYFAGAESASEEVPEGFASRELAAGEYIVCSFEAGNFESLVMDALYKAQRYLYNTWLPKHNLQTEPFCAERYANHSPDTADMEIWLELKK